MRAFFFAESWNWTPMDLGLPPEDLDPWYEDAMLALKTGYSRAMQDDMRSD